MNLSIIWGPLIGAVIGYCTNYIAVKMLFWPRKPIKVGKFRVPFTPGIIPKGKDRLARAIGETIGDTLLTHKDIEATLLSEDLRKDLSKSVVMMVHKSKENDYTIKDLVEKVAEEKQYEKGKKLIEDMVAENVLKEIKQVDIGNIVSMEGSKVLKEKVRGTFLAMMVNDDMINSFTVPVSERINKYIDDNGEEMISTIISKEVIKVEGLTIYEAMENMNIEEESLSKMIDSIYTSFVKDRVETLMSAINLSGIVEEKIKNMDVLEIENMILSVMKKELGAVVNLGAVIGFILGLLNILI